jgi:membrane protein
MENKDIKRGRMAERPIDIPSKGLKEVMLRVKDNFTADYLDVVSAGVGFYFFLALFPLFAAMFAIYGLAFDPTEVQQQMDQLTEALPEQAHELISEGLQGLAGQGNQGLGVALIIGIFISLWSANQGTKALFDGINIAYHERITRGFIKNNIISLVITLSGIIIGIICAALVIGWPAVVDNIGLPETIANIISFTRWIILFVVVMLFISMVYKFAPDRDNPKFRWVSWGSVVGTILWIIASLLFSLYVNNFGDFDATYGSVAAVIILMLWFQLTALCILLGAEINSELEHQTSIDTTVGKPKPMGQRDAFMADHVAGDGSENSSVIGSSKKDFEKGKKDRERFQRPKRQDYNSNEPKSRESENKNRGLNDD